MRFVFVPFLVFAVLALPAHAQQILDVVDDGSGELVLNLSKLAEDISSYELFFDGKSLGEFSGDESSVTMPSPTYGHHLVEITVVSRFTGAKANVSFVLNFLEPKEEEKKEPPIPVPPIVIEIAGKIVALVPGGGKTVGATSVVASSAVAVSSVVAASSTAVVASISSLADLGNYLLHILISMLEIFGVKRKSKPWGTVYDSLTKKPIPFAKVELLDEHSRILETKIADSRGRFGFLVSPRSLIDSELKAQLVAEKVRYRFPSTRVTPPNDTVLYDNVYVGGIVTVQTNVAVNFNLPMDPEKFELKKVAKVPAKKLHNSLVRVADIGFWVGLATAPLEYLSSPNLFSFTILILFLILAFLRVIGLRGRTFGLVVDAKTAGSLPFALITLDDELGRRKGFTVSDERGRYFLVAEKGDYNLNVYTPVDIQPPRSVVKKIHTGRGWIIDEIKL